MSALNTPGSGILAVFACAFAIMVFAGDARAGDECFVIDPFVTHVDAASAKVIGIAPAGAAAGELALERADGEPVQPQRFEARASVPRFQRRGEDDLEKVRQLVALDDLAPHTTYRYRAHCADGGAVRTGSFTTAPEPGRAVPFTFVVMSDGHGSGHGGVHAEVAAAVARDEPAFVVHTGDFAGGRGHDWGGWLSYFRNARPHLEMSTLWPVVGGHDVRPARNFRALFGFNDPEGDPADEDSAATFYSFRFANLHYIVLDYVYDIDAQVEWVERELADSDATWTFVSLHDSFFTVGSRGSLMSDGKRYREFAELFETHGVDVVIFGHDHIYERSLPIGMPGRSPVHYITTNAGGNFRVTRPSPIVAGGIGQQKWGHATFHIDGRELRMRVVEPDGSVIDEMTLIKQEDGSYQPEVMERAVSTDLALELAHIYVHGDRDLYNRRDMMIELESLPRPGERVRATLDVSRFPEGSRLIVHEQSDSQRWRTEARVIDLEGDSAAVELIAPDEMIYASESLRPRPTVRLNLELDGRRFEPVTVEPTLGPDTRRMLSLDELPERIGLDMRTYSRDLVPATPLELPDEPAFSAGLRSRDVQRYLTWADAPAAEIELTVTGGGISAARYRERGDFDLEMHRLVDGASDDAGEPVAVAAIERTNESQEVTLRAQEPGLHRLQYDDSRDITRLDWPAGTPMTLTVAPEEHPTDHINRWDMVFYVPDDVDVITGHADARRGTIRDPAGEEAFDFDRYTGFFTIPVTSDQRGTIWSLRGFQGEIYFLDIPPYLARSAAELLLPRELVETADR